MSLAAKRELLALLERKLALRARDDLNAYCRYIDVPGAPLNDDEDCEEFYPDSVTPAAHHELINNTMMDLEAGRKKRVIVMMPPGSAKSTYGTVVFPTWYMGRNPGKSVISTSYGSSLSLKFSRKVRQVVKSPKFSEVFNTELVPDNRALEFWSLKNQSSYMCGGILSGITGNRADGLVIDDPVKGREQADSQTIREKTWEAYTSDLRTRLKPNGWILLIQTRWHEDDLAGRILPDDWDGESGYVTAKDGEEWYVVCLQAQCEREDDPLGREIGEWLWTDWFSPEHWAQEKLSQGSRNWESLYQQRPKPLEGSIIKRIWPKRYNTRPAEFMRLVMSLDTAYKPEQHNDPSVLTIWGEVEQGHHLLHVWRDRVEYPELKRIVANYYMNWRADAVLIEDKASGQSLIQELRQGVTLSQFPNKIVMPVIAIEPEGSKLNRAIRVSSQFEAGRVWLPEHEPWLIDYESELFGFPLATHDDQVDSTTQYLEWASNRTIDVVSASTGRRDTSNAGDLGLGDMSSGGGRGRFGGYL